MTSREAETLVEEQALRFEKGKPYLIEIWNEKAAQKAEKSAF
jgi:hypothetical protein